VEKPRLDDAGDELEKVYAQLDLAYVVVSTAIAWRHQPSPEAVYRLLAAVDAFETNPNHGTCVFAETRRCQGLLSFGADPYTQELYADTHPVWMCEEHRRQRADEI
jgi:hypothetical protein